MSLLPPPPPFPRLWTDAQTPHDGKDRAIQSVARVKSIEQEAQLMLTTGSTRLAVSRGQQTWPFHMLHIVSYCAIVTLSLRRAVFTIFVFKEFHDLEMGSKVTQGH